MEEKEQTTIDWTEKLFREQLQLLAEKSKEDITITQLIQITGSMRSVGLFLNNYISEREK